MRLILFFPLFAFLLSSHGILDAYGNSNEEAIAKINSALKKNQDSFAKIMGKYETAELRGDLLVINRFDNNLKTKEFLIKVKDVQSPPDIVDCVKQGKEPILCSLIWGKKGDECDTIKVKDMETGETECYRDYWSPYVCVSDECVKETKKIHEAIVFLKNNL